VLILSVVAIIVAVNTYLETSSIEATAPLLAIGFISMAMAGYILFQSRKRVASLKIENPPILTTIECRKCGIKTVREFQRGDYVFKELDKCQKCEDKQVITAIYREVKEKEKPVNV
jgi:ribosomal protein L40E